MRATLQEIVNLLNAQYPQVWAAPGDRTGFQVGDPSSPVTTVLVALEASPAVIREAQGLGAQLLLTHHPLIYQPLAQVREDQPAGKLLSTLIRAGIASVSCHTNLDVAPEGLNDYLARTLELTEVEVLAETSRDNLYKLTVFVPLAYEDLVRDQLAEAGLGIIGRYSHCSFGVRGQGTYRPMEGAQPFRGEVGQLAQAEEVRLEMLAPESILPAALAHLQEVHPYEEVAYDLYPLKNPGAARGFGRLGNWPAPKNFDEVISLAKRIFQVDAVKVWGRPPQTVQRLAVLGGSGGEFIQTARQRRAQAYITGEVRHHQVSPESLEDFAVLEVGHYSSEAVFMSPWAQQLRGFFAAAGLDVRVNVAQSPQTPFAIF
ncbi:MAG: Nif3-like dinuclear metal center hexameric protein [Deltaproteobacteria bacterium]|nr:Nif3-like dinuclear metal center hexameric protein [Deltaproteobacteria bacterium]